MEGKPEVWWVHRWDHDAIPARPGQPMPDGYVEMVPKSDYDRILENAKTVSVRQEPTKTVVTLETLPMKGLA